MDEGFLSYLWQFQYFDRKKLKTVEGEALEIFNPGILNSHAGPDFSNSRVKIDGIEWVGTIELHVKSSNWMDHRHDTDAAYENVTLHVVWVYDQPVYRSDSTCLPTLELKYRVDQLLLKQYHKLVSTSFAIPCKKSFHQVESVLKQSMMDRAAVERLETKSKQGAELLQQNLGDWQETAFVLIAQNFGFKVNSEPFRQLALSTPYKLLLKHSQQLLQVEALLFGQAGFLEIPVGDGYYQLLRREYLVLGKKYNLERRKLKRAQWRFLRLRPANFPTVRLAQFAALITQQMNLFGSLFRLSDYKTLRDLFSITQSPYWLVHYQFNRSSKQKVPELGESSIDNLLINSVAPLLVAYGKYMGDSSMIDRAIEFLNRIPAESNAITKAWGRLGTTAANAFESQGLIELYNNYCQKRNCLNCAIGVSLLKPRQ